MNKKDIAAFLTSLTLHLAVLLIALHLGGEGNEKGNSKEKGKGEGNNRYKGVDASTVIEKERPTEVEIVEQPEIKSPMPKKPKKQAKNADKECPGKWYGGIGVQTGFEPVRRLITIDRIFSGYPADIAGLQVGDIILNVSDNEILGEPGTQINMLIERNGQILAFSFKRGKVCY